MSGALQLSAPGKMMIIGEYAVLERVPAVVAAVDRRVRLRAAVPQVAEPFSMNLPAEAVATRELAERELGAVADDLMLDVSALRSGDQKLGVGSSAAAAAVVAAFMLQAHGHPLSDPSVRQRAMKLALSGHHAVAPRGSGADVAACSLGGFVRFVRHAAQEVEATPLSWPSEVCVRVVWTGQQVRTSDMLDAVAALRRRDPAALQVRMAELRDAAGAFMGALAAASVADMIQATAWYGEAMGRLGDAVQAPIVESKLRTIADTARNCGGAAKPSGAGGGDVALALFPDAQRASHFESACTVQGLHVLHLGLGVQGIRVDGEESGS